MNFDWRHALGVLALAMAVVGYIPYFRDLLAYRTKPHAFSWLIWTLLTAIGFAGQMSDGAGPGAWVTGFTALMCFAVFILAIGRGEKEITRGDWICLIASLAAIPLWLVTAQPLLAMILVTVIDALGFFPTFRKAFLRPQEETVSTYFLSGLKFLVGLIALQNITLITTLYPLSLVIMNWVFVVMVLARRKTLATTC